MKKLIACSGALLLAVAAVGLPAGCVIEGGRVSGRAVFYWPLPGPWFYEGPWIDGGVWIHHRPVFSPPPLRGPAPHLPNRIRPAPGPRR